jgi:3,4-dihydroxy 2-butanone 4-phosphate synthase/GTP cyclohydrolase II
MKEVEIKLPPVELLVAERQAIWYEPWVVVERAKEALTGEESMIEELGRAPLPTEYGDYTYVVFGDYSTAEHHEILLFGKPDNIKDNMLVRVHSSCRTNEVYHAINCECRKEIEETMRQIQREGCGAIIYLEQEGRGTGISGKMAQLNGMFHWVNDRIEQQTDPLTGERIDTDRAYREAGYPSECRDFTVAGQILHHMGVKSVRLITNNPLKIKGVESFGVKVTPVGIHVEVDNEIIASDLKSKAKNLGHKISDEQAKVGKHNGMGE